MASFPSRPSISLDRDDHGQLSYIAGEKISHCGEFLCENTHDYGDKIINLKAYFVESTQGNFQLLAHQDIEWLELKEMLNLDWAEADLPIVTKLINHFS